MLQQHMFIKDDKMKDVVCWLLVVRCYFWLVSIFFLYLVITKKNKKIKK